MKFDDFMAGVAITVILIFLGAVSGCHLNNSKAETLARDEKQELLRIIHYNCEDQNLESCRLALQRLAQMGEPVKRSGGAK